MCCCSRRNRLEITVAVISDRRFALFWPALFWPALALRSTSVALITAGSRGLAEKCRIEANDERPAKGGQNHVHYCAAAPHALEARYAAV